MTAADSKKLREQTIKIFESFFYNQIFDRPIDEDYLNMAIGELEQLYIPRAQALATAAQERAEDIANLRGHRMECYIKWLAYSKKVKESNYNRSFAEYLCRRFNDLTDQLVELTGDKSFAHYDMDFKTGKPIDRAAQPKEPTVKGK